MKFCTNPQQLGIMTVDPTFSLGNFYVTIITYHLFLCCRHTTNHPVFIGSVMLHCHKTFSTYLYFASTPVGLCPDMSNLNVLAQIGEEQHFTAFSHKFLGVIHLLCSTHMQCNIKSKLHELRVDEPVKTNCTF